MWDILNEAKYIKKTTDMYAGGLPTSPGNTDSLTPDPIDGFEFGGAPTTPNYTDQIP